MALICVPIMLIFKPTILFLIHKFHHKQVAAHDYKTTEANGGNNHDSPYRGL